MKKFILTLAFSAVGMVAFADDANEKVYFFDDFEWLKPVTDVYVNKNGEPITDNVGENYSRPQYNPQAETQIWDTSNGFPYSKTKSYLADLGYNTVPYNITEKNAKAPKYVGVAKNYIKIAITDVQGGIVLPQIDEWGEGTKKVHLSFVWTPLGEMKQIDPESTDENPAKISMYDKSKVAIIVENEGVDPVKVQVLSLDIPDGTDYKWYPVDIDFDAAGVPMKSTTKIILRNDDDQYPTVTGVYRWFIDNIKLYQSNGAGVGEIAMDDNAPVSFYNLQGVKVANPENGVYIRRQGAKSSKVVLK